MTYSLVFPLVRPIVRPLVRPLVLPTDSGNEIPAPALPETAWRNEKGLPLLDENNSNVLSL